MSDSDRHALLVGVSASDSETPGHQFITWDTIVEDTASAWSAGAPTVYPAPVSGWYQVHGTVSLSDSTAGATGLVLIPAVAINGNSPIGTATTGQEGMEVFVPTVSTDPKVSVGDWFGYANQGDSIQLDLWFSTESSITTVSTTAGARCRIQIVGVGV